MSHHSFSNYLLRTFYGLNTGWAWHWSYSHKPVIVCSSLIAKLTPLPTFLYIYTLCNSTFSSKSGEYFSTPSIKLGLDICLGQQNEKNNDVLVGTKPKLQATMHSFLVLFKSSLGTQSWGMREHIGR